MVNYQLGKIYRIVCNTTGLTYYGSTCEKNLSSRLSHHKSVYKQYLNQNHHFITSFEIIKNNNYVIVLVENYPCNSKDELHSRERFYIENNECINKNIPTRTINEWIEENKDRVTEQKKKYYNANKQTFLEKRAQYYQSNKEHIIEHNKQYRKEHKDDLAEKKKRYYKKNKEVIGEKKKHRYNTNKQTILERRKQLHTCECGSVICFGAKTRHLKTKKHQLFLEQKKV